MKYSHVNTPVALLSHCTFYLGSKFNDVCSRIYSHYSRYRLASENTPVWPGPEYVSLYQHYIVYHYALTPAPAVLHTWVVVRPSFFKNLRMKNKKHSNC